MSTSLDFHNILASFTISSTYSKEQSLVFITWLLSSIKDQVLSDVLNAELVGSLPIFLKGDMPNHLNTITFGELLSSFVSLGIAGQSTVVTMPPVARMGTVSEQASTKVYPVSDEETCSSVVIDASYEEVPDTFAPKKKKKKIAKDTCYNYKKAISIIFDIFEHSTIYVTSKELKNKLEIKGYKINSSQWQALRNKFPILNPLTGTTVNLVDVGGTGYNRIWELKPSENIYNM